LNALNPSLLKETAAAAREMNDDDGIKALELMWTGGGY
jgi:hypothetical protein